MKIDRLVHSKRKTIALIVEDDGSLTVRAPLRFSMKRILELVEQKAKWVQSKQALAKSLPPTPGRQTYANGDTFWYLGKTYPLDIVTNAPEPLRLEGKFFLRQSALPHAASAFTQWYKAQARHAIGQRVQQLAAKHGFQYKQIKITSAQGRWGSCSSQGTLCFTWRLIMTPPDEIDYVVVHELAHLVEKNHSKAFWEKVTAILPDYKIRRKWLKDHGHLLRLVL
jgi:predicted metal-dependent hydrolase